jgi:imidazolonepropionase-like amidohydrolase
MANATGILFRNGKVFDGVHGELHSWDVLVEGQEIVEVGGDLRSDHAQTVDLGGKILMPGLIDAHIHAYAAAVDLGANDRLPMTFVAHDGRRMLEDCLKRGFTSVRDTGGGDIGLRMAIEDGLVAAPRFFYSGKAISQTAGHGDFKRPYEGDLCSCGGGYQGHLTVVVDGVADVRRTIRRELGAGADFIKIMASGGICSVGDSLHSGQFSDEEILAAVDEVERHETYVTAHVHPDKAMRRAIELGVHGIEHGTFISKDTAKLAAERGTAIVPTLAFNETMSRYGRAKNFPEESLEKLAVAQPQGLIALETMRQAGVRIGFGTDLIGDLDRHQCTEFTIRQEVCERIEILRSATSINAEIIGQGDRLGHVAPGFLADLIVIDGNPLDDLAVFDDKGSRLSMIVLGGRVIKAP